MMPVRQARPHWLSDAGFEESRLTWLQAYSEVHSQVGLRWIRSTPPYTLPFDCLASGSGVTMGWPSESKVTMVGLPTSWALSHIRRSSTHFFGSGANQLAPMICW